MHFVCFVSSILWQIAVRGSNKASKKKKKVIWAASKKGVMTERLPCVNSAIISGKCHCSLPHSCRLIVLIEKSSESLSFSLSLSLSLSLSSSSITVATTIIITSEMGVMSARMFSHMDNQQPCDARTHVGWERKDECNERCRQDKKGEDWSRSLSRSNVANNKVGSKPILLCEASKLNWNC